MTDLHASLLALLKEVEEREPHTPQCAYDTISDTGGRLSWCTCDWRERVRDRVARAWEASLDAGDFALAAARRVVADGA